MTEAFELADDPQRIFRRLRDTRAEFAHLADARVVCIFSAETPVLRGAPCAAFVGHPVVQGPMRTWFDWAMQAFCRPVLGPDAPDFVIVFDGQLWTLLDAERQERLVYHEICHIETKNDEYGIPKLGKDGRLLLRLVPHDRELFDAELLQYGSAVCGHGDLGKVVAEGDAQAARRRFRITAA